MNFPAVSDASVMQTLGHTRNAEREALLNFVDLQPGDTLLDIQAAGGYLSDGAYELLEGEVHCICVEPCSTFHTRLNPRYTVVADPIHDFRSVPSASVDKVMGLAGLHHSESHQATMDESYRVLRSGGWFAVCDVITDSPIAWWLNEFVDKNSPAGHKGRFLQPGALSEFLKRAGFTSVREERRNVPWVFSSKKEMYGFFRGLFNIHCDENELRSVFDRTFSYYASDQGISVDWELIYGRGQKPTPSH